MEKELGIDEAGPVIVALGFGDEGQALIARGRAIAESERRGMECLTVDDGGLRDPEDAARLAAHRELARSGGAQIVGVPGIDVAQGVLDYARARRAAAVVVGCDRGFVSGTSIAARLRKAHRPFTLVAICPPLMAAGRAKSRPFPSEGSPAQYAAAFLAVACVTGANLVLASYAGYWAAAVLYLAAISLGALWLDSMPVVFAACLSALAWDYLFIPPRFRLSVSRPEDVLMLALYLLVSISSGLMTSRLRASESLIRGQRDLVSRINSLALSLVGASSTSTMLGAGIEFIEGAIDCEAICILKGPDGGLKREAESGWEPLDADARAAASICFEGGRAAGRFTDAVPSSEWHFLPLESPRGRLGVIGTRSARGAIWDESVEAFARASVSTIAIALAARGSN